VEDEPAHVRLTEEGLDEVRLISALHVVDSGEAALAFLRRQDPYPGAPQPGLIMADVYLPVAAYQESEDAIGGAPEYA
jgi:CheY-like chemotaxis protein